MRRLAAKLLRVWAALLAWVIGTDAECPCCEAPLKRGDTRCKKCGAVLSWEVK